MGSILGLFSSVIFQEKKLKILSTFSSNSTRLLYEGERRRKYKQKERGSLKQTCRVGQRRLDCVCGCLSCVHIDTAEDEHQRVVLDELRLNQTVLSTVVGRLDSKNGWSSDFLLKGLLTHPSLVFLKQKKKNNIFSCSNKVFVFVCFFVKEGEKKRLIPPQVAAAYLLFPMGLIVITR
jgi:hypothetical protein